MQKTDAFSFIFEQHTQNNSNDNPNTLNMWMLDTQNAKTPNNA